MPACLTLASSKDTDYWEFARENHGAYCALYGYSHAFEDIGHVAHNVLARIYVLHAASRALRTIPEGDLLMVMTADSAVFRPVRLEELMEGHSVLLNLENAQPGYEPKPQMNWLVVRNDALGRARLGIAIFEAHKQALHDPHRVDSTIYTNLGALGYYNMVAGFHLNLNWQNNPLDWFLANIFIVNTLPLPLRGIDQAWHENPFIDRRFGLLLLREVHAASRGAEFMKPRTYPALAQTPYTAYNAKSPIALVTMYTHHIEGHGRISEHNVKRYCDRHGLAYHVYRAIPADLDQSVSGAWHKAWLLERHFEHHDWVIWIDSDILFINHEKRLEDLLEGRDVLVAKDIGGYEFNSGVMGFRRTDENRRALAHIRARISAVEDKSTVHASGGDQEQSIIGLLELGRLEPGVVCDCLGINTPPLFATEASLMVHYMGMQDLYRNLYMTADDTRSLAAHPIVIEDGR